MKKNLVRTNGNLFPTIPSLFEDFFTKDWLDSSLDTWKTDGATLPAVNVMENDDNFNIEVAAPGMDRDDFNVTLQNNVLTISSEWQNKTENTDSETKYTRREFSYRSFQRTFSLPEDKVEGDKISARYTDGILRINIPKKEDAKKAGLAKKITIS